MSSRDFEVLPVGTIETVGAAAQMFRDLRDHQLKHAHRVGSPYARTAAVKATLYGNMATRLEALLAGRIGAKPTEHPPRSESR